jgi:hypothetical protein
MLHTAVVLPLEQLSLCSSNISKTSEHAMQLPDRADVCVLGTYVPGRARDCVFKPGCFRLVDQCITCNMLCSCAQQLH